MPDILDLDRLILKACKGDMEALETLYNALEGSVYALALSIVRNAATAQDITQETFVKICTAGAGFSPRGLGKAWVLKIARNLALAAYKKNRRFADIDLLPESALSDGDTFDDRQLERILLKSALETLGDNDRQIVLLHASGLKHDEIALIVQRPAATVRWKYAQAIKKLSRLMDERGREGTPHDN